MSKMKKVLNKELMFEKIMPSNSQAPKQATGMLLSNEPTEPSEPMPMTLTPSAPAELHIKLSMDAPAPAKETLLDSVAAFAAPAPSIEPAEDSKPVADPIMPAETIKPTDPADVEPPVQENATIIEDDMSPPNPVHSTLVLVNVMEDLVVKRLDEIMIKFKCCRCKRCRMDVTAMALNHLTPKYVANSRDQLFDLLDRQQGAEVITALVRAVIAVKAQPRHDLY